MELEIPCKALTDIGLNELAQGLLQTYRANEPSCTIVRLEEIDLKGNRLSPASLIDLSAIVQLACNDLRDLDLSSNQLCINSTTILEDWQQFLRALSKCCVLRRLDLSNNQLGAKAFEVLARVYGQESPIDLVLPADLVAMVEFAGLNDATRSLSIASTLDEHHSHEDEAKGSARRNSRHGV